MERLLEVTEYGDESRLEAIDAIVPRRELKAAAPTGRRPKGRR